MKPLWTVGFLVGSGVPTLGCSAGEFAIDADDSGLVGPEVGGIADVSLAVTAGEKAGELDTAFGNDGTGIVRLSFGADDDGGFFSLDVAGSKVVASGWGAGGLGGSTFRLARLMGDGTADGGFAGGSIAATHWSESTADFAYAVAVGHQSDGGIITMGWRAPFHDESANIALVHHGADGSVSGPAFGPEGKRLLDLGGDEEVKDGVVLDDDRILVVGRRDGRVLVARATAEGALDTSFAAPYGFWTASVAPAATGRSVAVDEEGRILVAGWVDQGGQTDALLLRLTPDGALDTSFAKDGILIVGGPALNERAVAVAPSPGGRIVVAGDAGPVGASEFAKARDFQVRRFLGDGAPDIEFGAGGVVSSVTTEHDDEVEDMVVLPDESILVGGNARVDPNTDRPMLVRYTRQGAPDPGLGDGGVLTLDLGEYGVLHSIRVYSQAQVIVAGGDVGMSPGPGTFGVVARVWM